MACATPVQLGAHSASAYWAALVRSRTAPTLPLPGRCQGKCSGAPAQIPTSTLAVGLAAHPPRNKSHFTGALPQFPARQDSEWVQVLPPHVPMAPMTTHHSPPSPAAPGPCSTQGSLSALGQGSPEPHSPHLYPHQLSFSSLEEEPGPSVSRTSLTLGFPPRATQPRRLVYLSKAAGVVLGLGGGPQQARWRRGRAQLQDTAEVSGVGRGTAGCGGGHRVVLLALGGQAELLGSSGEERAAQWAQRCPTTHRCVHTHTRPSHPQTLSAKPQML